jgi:pyruvate formate lyase activating enzyme
MDEAKHKELTGKSNRLILENAKKLLATEKAQVVVRIPVIPGENDSEENVAAIARFAAEAGGKVIELLPYHRLGISKHKQLDITYELKEVPRPSEESMQRLSRIVKSVGIEELYGDSGPCIGS